MIPNTSFRRDETFHKWRRFAEDSQTVLIYGMVPRQAVLASIPLLHILRKLPSYFLRKDIQLIDGNPLDQVAWNYTSRKLGYHQFCRELSTLFLNHPDDVKLRDSTGGAVRLALSFLRPFFHNVVQDQFDIAIWYLRSLAISISEWPANGWVRNYPEVRQIVDSMALALGEELREKYALQHRTEINRLQLVIDGLEHSILSKKDQVPALYMDDVDVDSDGDYEVQLEDINDPTLVQPLDTENKEDINLVNRRSSLKLSIAVLPRLPVSFETPITPPDSPHNSLLFPTVTVPLGNLVSKKFSFPAMNEEYVKPSPSSERLASPPLTPPPLRSPVFSRPERLVDGPTMIITSLDEKPDISSELSHITENDQESEILENEVEQILRKDVFAQPDQSYVEEIDDDDDEKTEPGDDLPLSIWSSPRSSIFSIETLCDDDDLPSKRLSLGHSRSNSYDVFGRMSPLASVRASRTVSFSKSMSIPTIFPLKSDPVADPLAIIPSLPSPALSRPDSPVSASIPSSPSLQLSPSLPLTSQARHDHPDYLQPSIIVPKRVVSLLSPLDYDEDSDSSDFRPSSITENASYIVTGFLVGAFLTLFLFSTQRRNLLYVT